MGALGREGSCGRLQALVWALVFGEGVSEEVPALEWASPSPSCFCSGLATAWSQGSEEESLSERVGLGRRGMLVKGQRNLHLEILVVGACLGVAGRGVGLSQWSMLPHPPQPSIPGWVGVLVSTQIEQPGSWGPFPSQLLGRRDLDIAKGLG